MSKEHLIIAILIIVILSLAYHLVDKLFENIKLKDQINNHGINMSTTNPQIIVNMPADAKPLDKLTSGEEVQVPVTINNEKAILWWTVYNYTVKNFKCEIYECVNAADGAVDKCYPE